MRPSLEEGLKMMGKLEMYTRNNAALEYVDASLKAIAKARAKLTERLTRAQ